MGSKKNVDMSQSETEVKIVESTQPEEEGTVTETSVAAPKIATSLTPAFSANSIPRALGTKLEKRRPRLFPMALTTFL